MLRNFDIYFRTKDWTFVFMAIAVSRVLTVFEDSTQTAQIMSVDGFTPKGIVNALNRTIMLIEEKIATMNSDEPIKINNGSFYDEIVFEVSVYISGEKKIVANPTFGRLVDPHKTQMKGLIYVVNVLKTIVNSMIAEQNLA